MARQLVEKDGRYAVVIDDPVHFGMYAVVTARMRNPMGAGAKDTKFPHDGPNDNLTEEAARIQCGRWERYLEDVARSDEPSGARKKKVPGASQSRRS